MIIGQGLISTAFLPHQEYFDDCIIFASGVSNSEETKESEYIREKKLVLKTINEHRSYKFIYFSSILTEVINNRYYNFKLEIENLIKNNSSNYIIFRIPQILGDKGNSKNLVNFLKNNILEEKKINIENSVERSIIDVDDLVKTVIFCKNKTNCQILNFSGIEKIKVMELCNLIGKILNKNPLIEVVESKIYQNWYLENSEIIEESINKIDKKNYTYKILKKYLKK